VLTRTYLSSQCAKAKRKRVDRQRLWETVLAYIKARAMRERGRYMTVSTTEVLRAAGVTAGDCKAARKVVADVLKSMGAEKRSDMYKLTIPVETALRFPVEPDPTLKPIRMICAGRVVA